MSVYPSMSDANDVRSSFIFRCTAYIDIQLEELPTHLQSLVHIHLTHAFPRRSLRAILKLLLFPKERRKANNRPIYQQSPTNTHRGRRHANIITVRQQHRQRDPLHAQEARQEPAEIDNGAAAAAVGADEVVAGAGAFVADEVRKGRYREGRDDQERVVGVEEGAGEDAEEEAYGEDLLRVY